MGIPSHSLDLRPTICMLTQLGRSVLTVIRGGVILNEWLCFVARLSAVSQLVPGVISILCFTVAPAIVLTDAA